MSASHAHIDAALKHPGNSAAALGYRMPAEWEPMDAVWVTPPHNPETWPGEGAFERAAQQHGAWVEAMQNYGVTVRTPAEVGAATDDSWMRDYGPIYVVREEKDQATKGPRDQDEGEDGHHAAASIPAAPPALALHDFRFNAWGGKYKPYDRDDVLPQHIAAADRLPVWIHDMVLEGGAIEVNGQGTVMTTAQCLFEAGRNPGFTREQIEQRLHSALGTRWLIVLPGGIAGDDTDGHIDDVARFIDPTTVAAVLPHPEHPDHGVLVRNVETLRHVRDQDDRPLDIIELPAPEPIFHDFPPDRFGPGGRSPLPASYANFLVINGHVFLPVFGQPTDDLAARRLDDAMPDHMIVPVRAEHLVVGLGACHCLSMQQPAIA